MHFLLGGAIVLIKNYESLERANVSDALLRIEEKSTLKKKRKYRKKIMIRGRTRVSNKKSNHELVDVEKEQRGQGRSVIKRDDEDERMTGEDKFASI